MGSESQNVLSIINKFCFLTHHHHPPTYTFSGLYLTPSRLTVNFITWTFIARVADPHTILPVNVVLSSFHLAVERSAVDYGEAQWEGEEISFSIPNY